MVSTDRKMIYRALDYLRYSLRQRLSTASAEMWTDHEAEDEHKQVLRLMDEYRDDLPDCEKILINENQELIGQNMKAKGV